MNTFKLTAPFKPTGDQPQAIEKLTAGIEAGQKHQTLLGVTGSGKSVTGDTPIFVKQGTMMKQECVGELIDRLFTIFQNKIMVINNSEVILTNDLLSHYQYEAYSINPQTKKTSWRPIMQLIRHRSPAQLYQVYTTCGREVTVTENHNFFVLRDGEFVLTDTRNLKSTDSIPIPLRLPSSLSPLIKLNLLDYLPRRHALYATVPNFKSLWHAHEKILRPLLTPTKIHNIIHNHERVSIDLFTKIIKTVPALAQDAFIGVKGIDYQTPPTLPLTNTFLRFLGYYIAEGHGDDKYFILSSGDREVIDDFTSFLSQQNLYWKQRPHTYDYQISSAFWADLLIVLCGKNSHSKHLPSFWPQLSQKHLSHLLRAYFSGDGGVDGDEITCITVSNRLASELMYALLRFGIVARMKKRLMKLPRKDERRAYWTVRISGKQYLESFRDQIGFSIKAKQNKLSGIIHENGNTNVDVIPVDGAWLKRTREKLGLYQRNLAKKIGTSRSALSFIEGSKRKPSRSLFDRLTLALQQVAKKKHETLIVENIATRRDLLNCFWSPVKKIIPVPGKKYVYDFSVEDNETFLAGRGGLFVHNTFTMANVIQRVQKPTLVISHNKTLAAQLASEFKEFFPDNAVHYFVSYYDYYQPEAYMPQTDTYIEKETQINEEIDRLRHASTQALLSRKDVIIVASVSCIYGLGSPEEYKKQSISISIGDKKLTRPQIIKNLVSLQYQRNDIDLKRGTFRIRGETLDIFPTDSLDYIIRVGFVDKNIEKIELLDPLTGKDITNRYKLQATSYKLSEITIFPATHYVAPNDRMEDVLELIRAELHERLTWLKKNNKLLEAQRLEQRTTYDLEMLYTAGYCNGIENYSRYFDKRSPGEPPYTLIDYFPNGFLMFIDESHMTIPQIGGMYGGDRSRKQQLIDYGFRLPSAFDNRPLNFKEFESKVQQVIYVSATPGPYELQLTTHPASMAGSRKPFDTLAIKVRDNTQHTTKNKKLSVVSRELSVGLVQQLIRPTGLLDPTIEIKPSEHQIDDLLAEIRARIAKHQRVLVTTLTKRMSEDLSDYLQDAGIKAYYLHSEIDTFERLEILRDLRTGKYDVIVGINLLREGLDLPEVSLIAILDADKEGFLRSDTAFIQTIGRAARHVEGHVIMFADKITGSMKRAIEETERRRAAQMAHNKKHGITPRGITKAIGENRLAGMKATDDPQPTTYNRQQLKEMPKENLALLISELKDQMDFAAKNLEFEKAAELRDQIKQLTTYNKQQTTK